MSDISSNKHYSDDAVGGGREREGMRGERERGETEGRD